MAERFVFLGMPGYGQVTGPAARAFWRASNRPGETRVRYEYREGSLLACNFNGLWCGALNDTVRGQRVDYFAMLHADCEPDDGWLDVLIDELEARQLDVLGVAVPIKDPKGLTSLALAHESGDTWRIKARLTLAEVMRLPETFTSEDVGAPLLLNTGCWVCRFNPAWASQVRFEINDRIVWNETLGVYQPQTEPEDWFFSRLCHEQGLRIGATRKVRLAHAGPTRYLNTHDWGTEEFDSAWADRSPLPDAGLRFPHDAAGWLAECEGRELARLAEGKSVLEIGSFCGRSTICLAQTAKAVAAVDTFDGRGTLTPGDTYELFRTNLGRYGVAAKVQSYRGESAETLPLLPPVYDLVFVDGSHDRESVSRDAALARGVLKPGGLLAFHDYGDRDFGVTEAVDELLRGGAELLNVAGTVAVVRPATPLPVE
jgi:SAM-dependent methyltransferase